MSDIEHRAYEEMLTHCFVFSGKVDEALQPSLRCGATFGLPSDGAYEEMHKIIAKLRKEEERDSDGFFGFVRVFSCEHAILKEALSVRWSVGPSVRWSVGSWTRVEKYEHKRFRWLLYMFPEKAYSKIHLCS